MEIEETGSDPSETNAEALPIEGEEAATPPSDTGEAEDVTEADLAQPKKRTAKDRIDELTADKYELRKEIDYLRSQMQPKAEAPAVVETAARPDPSQYDGGEYDPRYLEDLTDWKATEVVERRLQKLSQETQQREVEQQWKSRVAKASERMPDFEEKVIVGAQRNEWACSPEMAEALRSSDQGDDLAYHLATNPAEASRITRLSPALQLMELGKLEAKLAQPKPKAVTSAPEPAPQARGSGGKFTVTPDTDDFAAFEKQYGNG